MRYLILILALCLTASGQPIFGGGKVAAVIGPTGTTLPASCSGRTLFDLTAADGGNAAGIYRCSSGTYVFIGPSTGAGTGDVVGPAASVDGEAAVYDGITGKAIKRFAGTGIGLFTSGILSVDSGLQFNASTKSLGVFGPVVSGQTGTYLGKFVLNGITSGAVTIQTANAAGTWTMTLPDNDGTSGQVLTTNGSGVTSWSDAGASMVYPGAGVPNSTGSAWGTSYTVGTAANNLVQLNASAQLPAVSAALLTNFPTLNQNTSGTAASLSAAGGTLALSGGNGITLTTTGTTNVTLPTSGTLLATSTTDQGSIDLKEAAASGDNYWRLASPASLSGDRVLELPDAAGTAGQALVVGTPSGGTLPLVWATPIVSGAGNADSSVTDASTTAKGKVELAIASEVTTGSSSSLAVTPDALRGSDYGKKVFLLEVFEDATALATGDGKLYIPVPAEYAGWNIVAVSAHLGSAVSSSGAVDVDIARCAAVATGVRCSGTVADVLSTNLTVDADEDGSETAAAAAAINTDNDDLPSAGHLRIDVDGAGTGTKGLIVRIVVQKP